LGRHLSIAVVAALLLLVPIGSAQAEDFVVNSTADETDASPGDTACASASGDCTLRAAIQEANALQSDDTVRLTGGGAVPYSLTLAGAGEQLGAIGDLDVADNGTILVEGAAQPAPPVIDASLLGDRVFEVLAGARLELAGVVVTGGTGSGAAVLVGSDGLGSSLSVAGSFLSDNAGNGGTLRADGDADVTVADSGFSGNQEAFGGGGIHADDQSNVTVERSTFGGNVADFGGGGIFVQGDAVVSVANSVFAANDANFGGGAIFNQGDSPSGSRLDISQSFLTGNNATDQSLGGGALWNQNDALTTITDSLLNDNQTAGSLGGGALFNQNAGRIVMSRSTLEGNRARGVNGGDGGAVFGQNQSELTVVNTTFSGNHADQRGGAVYYQNQAVLRATNSTSTANTADVAGGSGYSDSSPNTPADRFYFFKNSIVAGNRAAGVPNDCSGNGVLTVVESQGHNLESNNSCGFVAAGDQVNTSPLLGPLAFNAGFTQTHALLSGSPAIDAADSVGCPATDQRGVPRPQLAACDIGAFELQPAAAPPAGPPPDQTGPQAAITSGPSGTVRDRTPTFTFAASEPGVTFECSLDGGTFVPCVSPFTAPRLGPGPHTFAVRARDAAGNLGPTTTVPFSVAQTLAELTAADPPTLARDVNVAPVGDGPVLVGVRTRGLRAGARASQNELKGVRFVPLEEARQVPVGSFLDTSRGTVQLQSARNRRGGTQTGEFVQGIFQVLQSRARRARGLTELRLKGSNFNRCRRGRPGRAGAAQLSRRTIRRLRANARGRFRTRGRHSAATVRGTIWITADRCDGTLTTVKRGRVAVRDFRRKRTIAVRAGKSYLARAKG